MSITTQVTPYGTLPPAAQMPTRRPVSLPRLQEMRERGEKITMLTAYDATFAAVADAAGRGDDFGGRFAGHGLPGLEQHRRREFGDHVLPRRKRHPWPAPRTGHGLGAGRHAVWQLPRRQRASHPQRDQIDASRLAHGQIRRRRLDGGDCAIFGRARHPRLRPPGA